MNGNGLVVKRENMMMRKREKEIGIIEILVWPGRDRIWWVSRGIGLRRE